MSRARPTRACSPTSRRRKRPSTAVVADLDPAGWATPTPAEGWDVRDSIAHLAYTEDLAGAALTDDRRVRPPCADGAARRRATRARSSSGPGGR